MTCVPPVSLIGVVVMLAVATPPTFISVPVPMTINPSLKATVPVGLVLPTLGVTVAVRVTGPVLGSPNNEGLGVSTVMVVVVTAWLIVWVRLSELGTKLLLPRS